jgi:hypothetical protein
MVFKATFNNISVISWRSAVLVEETRVPEENHWPVARHWQKVDSVRTGIMGKQQIVIGQTEFSHDIEQIRNWSS